MHAPSSRPRTFALLPTRPLFLLTIVLLLLTTLPINVTQATAPRSAETSTSLTSLSFIKVVAGGSHTCALTSTGGVKCWGSNYYGQLGDGSTTDRVTPVDVSGLTSGVTAISAGSFHTCALTSTGGVKCWGYNNYGQLGDGSTTARLTTVDVSGLSSGVIAMSGGYRHTCALTSNGGVKCWGDNAVGQLGDGSTIARVTPVDVSGLTSGVTTISTNSNHTCALTSGGGVKCWGWAGGLGDGSGDRVTPVDVSGLASGVTAISTAANHTCALTSSGGVKCWGSNDFGQVGNGYISIPSRIPVDVSGLTSGITAISASYTHTCALTSTGGVKCWGNNNNGQLGDGSTTVRGTPVDVSGLSSGITTISTGTFHTCALTSTGGVKCWGSNSSGQLGNGTRGWSPNPMDVSGLSSGIMTISAGGSSICALTSNGGVKCWGRNSYGQLGDGSTTDRTTPVDVSGLTSGITAIAASGSHTCALTSNGGVKCWGYNSWSQLGDGGTINRLTPVDVSGLTSGVTAIAAGSSHTCALTSTGGVKCWGSNSSGQLGDGSFTARTTPVDVSMLTSGVTAIVAGDSHTCALTSNGGVKCWGSNFSGALGNNGRIGSFPNPMDVSGLTSGVTTISAGYSHTCALTSTGGVKCWGGELLWKTGRWEYN